MIRAGGRCYKDRERGIEARQMAFNKANGLQYGELGLR